MARKKKMARSAEFKSKVALAAIQEQKTVQQLATLFEVHPTHVQVWKKQLLLGAVSLFQTGDRVQDTAAQQSRETELFEQIGRLNMELDWLKKKLPVSAESRRALIEPGHETLSIRRQCELLDLPRNTLYYRPASETLESSFCLEALEAALKDGQPAIFNTDQGSQFTSVEFTSRLLDRAVAVRMDGRGRALDNVFIERFWRSVKHEDICLKDCETVDELYQGLTRYFDMYNRERPHQALDYQTPYHVYHWGRESRSLSGSRVRVGRVGKGSAAQDRWSAATAAGRDRVGRDKRPPSKPARANGAAAGGLAPLRKAPSGRG